MEEKSDRNRATPLRISAPGAETRWHRSIRNTKPDVPLMILRMEGAGALAAAILVYSQTNNGWLMFALLFLVPDIFMAGYLLNPRVGSIVYNFAHSTLLPLLMVSAGFMASIPLLSGVGLIWFAHVGFDRAMGFGLKYADRFSHSHLGSRSSKTTAA